MIRNLKPHLAQSTRRGQKSTALGSRRAVPLTAHVSDFCSARPARVPGCRTEVSKTHCQRNRRNSTRCYSTEIPGRNRTNARSERSHPCACNGIQTRCKEKGRTGARPHSVVWNLVNEGATPRSLLEHKAKLAERFWLGKRFCAKLRDRRSWAHHGRAIFIRPGNEFAWFRGLANGAGRGPRVRRGRAARTHVERRSPVQGRAQPQGSAIARDDAAHTRNRRASGATVSCCGGPTSWPRLSGRA